MRRKQKASSPRKPCKKPRKRAFPSRAAALQLCLCVVGFFRSLGSVKVLRGEEERS